MRRVDGEDFDAIRPYFEQAAEVASQAMCLRAKCGSVIVNNLEIIGRGFNAPPLGDKAQRLCDVELDTATKPKYDKTCCVHAEWQAILDACKTNADKLAGSVLYFMRIDSDGNFTDAGEPFCTVCSRLSVESGIAEFALYNNQGADIYPVAEYNRRSYAAYLRKPASQ